MTKQNYTLMSNTELLDQVKNIHVYPSKLKIYIKHHFPELWDELIKRTSYLSDNEQIWCRLYCIEHEITTHPTCCGVINDQHCHNKVKWDRKKRQFYKFCSCKCVQNSDDTIERRKQTCQDTYGCDNVSQTNIVRQKISNAWKNMSSERLSDITKRRINTSISRYNGIGFSSQIIVEKIKEQINKRFSVQNISQSDEIKRQKENTCIAHFGVSNPQQSKQIRDKTEQTCISRYGVNNPSKNEVIKQKILQVFNERYEVNNPMQLDCFSEKRKQTCMNNNGVEYPLQSTIIQEKASLTCIKRYGVKYYTQSEEYHKNKRHKYHSEKYPELTFDSTWEVKVYEFCKDNNIEVEYSPSITYKYEYDGKTLTYHPDFLINGKVYEVKGDMFFRINESSGKEEMFCPYRYSEWSDEHYNWMCGKYEAKHQCMIKNNVIIIREVGMKDLYNVFMVNTCEGVII